MTSASLIRAFQVVPLGNAEPSRSRRQGKAMPALRWKREEQEAHELVTTFSEPVAAATFSEPVPVSAFWKDLCPPASRASSGVGPGDDVLPSGLSHLLQAGVGQSQLTGQVYGLSGCSFRRLPDGLLSIVSACRIHGRDLWRQVSFLKTGLLFTVVRRGPSLPVSLEGGFSEAIRSCRLARLVPLL